MKGLFITAGQMVTILLLVLSMNVSLSAAEEIFGGTIQGEIFELGDKIFGPFNVENPTGNSQLLGMEFDGAYIWLTGADPGPDPSKLYQLDINFNLIATYDQPPHCTGWGWRTMTFDGTYLYSSANQNIDQIDPATGNWTGNSIPGPLSLCRILSYDPDTDHFWVTGFNADIYEITRDGTIVYVCPFPGIIINGMAWDNISPDGPWLWMTTDVDGNGMVYQYDPSSCAFTGVSFPVGEAYNDSPRDCALKMLHPVGVLGILFQGNGLGYDYLSGYEITTELTCEVEITTPYVPSTGGHIFFTLTVTNHSSNPTPIYAEMYPTIGDCQTGVVYDLNINRMVTPHLGPGQTIVENYFYEVGDVSHMGLDLCALTLDVGPAIDQWSCRCCDTFHFYDPEDQAGNSDFTWGTAFYKLGEEELAIPGLTYLSPNYPNPFNSATTIPFYLSEPGYVTIKIYNLAGQVVDTPLDGYLDAGNHSVNWNAVHYSTGVYFIKMNTGGSTFIKRMTLIK